MRVGKEEEMEVCRERKEGRGGGEANLVGFG